MIEKTADVETSVNAQRVAETHRPAAPRQELPAALDEFPAEALAFVRAHAPGDLRRLQVVATSDPAQIDLRRDETDAIVPLVRANDVRYLNKFFIACAHVLPVGGTLLARFETKTQRKARIYGKYPRWWAAVFYLLTTFLLHRVCSKLPLVKRAYFAVTRGRNRPLSRAELMGRLYYCGFEVLDECEIEGLRYVAARKSGEPRSDPAPSYGPVFAMPRVGQGGKTIRVYKIRTMHPYAEYLQRYVFERNSLAAGGKLQDDFRVTGWGRLLRRCWIDELPMLVNWVRGDLKLVGVRPLSAHYESLYPPELRELRRRFKPGLVPPFYADRPTTFEEIVASEERYLAAYERRPLATDARYLARAAFNILVRGARSG